MPLWLLTLEVLIWTNNMAVEDCLAKDGHSDRGRKRDHKYLIEIMRRSVEFRLYVLMVQNYIKY